jgi:hypothetical protein
MGDVGAVATFLTTVADFFMDPAKFTALSRERKLEKIREGLDAALDASDYVAADKFMAMYRVLDEQTP